VNRNVGVGTDLERMTAAVHNAIFAENPVTRHVCQQIVARKLVQAGALFMERERASAMNSAAEIGKPVQEGKP
jgi:hypothetical protein